MTNIKIKAKALAQAEQPKQETEKAFNALLQEIAHIRQGVRGVRGLVNDALYLALRDYIQHSNKNSLQQLVCTACDYSKNGRKIYLYNLYNVKDYLASVGLKLEYTAKDGFAIYYKDGYSKPTDFESWWSGNKYSDFTPPKKETEKATKPATLEEIKQALKLRKLSYEDIAVIKSLIKDTTP